MGKKRSNFIDAHNHITTKFYSEEQIQKIMDKAIENDIEFMIVNGGHRSENIEVLELAKKYPIIKPAIGIHPEDGEGENDVLLYKHLINEDVVAIGEIGLDYYYEDAPSRENQLKSFENQVKLASELKLPVVIHIRDKEEQDLAYKDAYEILKKYKNLKIMLHTYAGDIEWAKLFLELGCYFSFSGVITFGSSDKTRKVLEFIPLDNILIETDAPYLRPHPFKNILNEPNQVLFTTYYAAGLKKVGVEKFVTKINSNLRKLFNLK